MHLKSEVCVSSLATGLVALLVGCAAPDPHPFQQYATAVKDAGDGLDKVLVQETSWSRDKYIQSVLDGSVKLRDTALLDRKAQFTVSFPASAGVTNEPTFYKLQDVRVTLLNLNEATEKYVNVLATLAGGDLVNPATFEAMAKDTDQSLNSIANKLNAQGAEGAIHIFSVGSSEIMRLVIEHRRHAALVKILKDSQPAIDDYSGRCVSLLRILDQSLAGDYGAKASALEDSFSAILRKKQKEDPKATLVGDTTAHDIIEQILQLNSDYLALVHSLKSAKAVYEKLPQGHEELLKSVLKQPTGLAAIKALSEEGKRLKNIYDELQQAPAPVSAKKG